nr:transposase, Ptta/En/Spm [Tanacetum cinerariifolium]GFA74570.1 transposase, Ptta/En/Spm [Tanacetum cinerariifolium]
DLYQWYPLENVAVYKAWKRVMSSRYSDILGQCRRDDAHRATMDNITSEASGSGMDEASEGRMREYITASSKRVADTVKAAIVEKHGPGASEHPPNDFDLWGEATEGRKK